MTEEKHLDSDNKPEERQSVLLRPQFSYRRFRSFFLFLAIYLPLAQLLCGKLQSWVLQRLVTNGAENILFWQAVAGGASRIVMLIPILLVWGKLRKAMRQETHTLSLRLLDSCGFTILFCGLTAAVVMATTQDMTQMAFAFTCFSCGLSMFLCGCFMGKQRLKTLSICYLSVLMLILIVFSATSFYFSSLTQQNVWEISGYPVSWWVAFFLTVQSIVVFLYPAIGYAALVLHLRDQYPRSSKSQPEPLNASSH